MDSRTVNITGNVCDLLSYFSLHAYSSDRSEWHRQPVERNLRTVDFVTNVLHSVLDVFHPGANILYFVVDALRGL
jgi:hypothetical protein